MRDASGNLGAPYATGRAVEGILGRTPDEISFGMNMTTLNFAISRAAGRDFVEGDEVLTTQLDHDGGVAPWVELAADKGLEVRVECNGDGRRREAHLRARARGGSHLLGRRRALRRARAHRRAGARVRRTAL